MRFSSSIEDQLFLFQEDAGAAEMSLQSRGPPYANSSYSSQGGQGMPGMQMQGGHGHGGDRYSQLKSRRDELIIRVYELKREIEMLQGEMDTL